MGYVSLIDGHIDETQERSITTFEDKVNFIETVLKVQLLDWQKKALRQVDEGKEMIWIPGKASGRTVYMKAVRILRLLNESLENNEGWENDNPTCQREYETRFK